MYNYLPRTFFHFLHRAAPYTQVTSKQTLAITAPAWSTAARAITEEELNAPSVVDKLRKAHLDALHWGQREVSIVKKAANKLAADKKAAKKANE